MSTRRVPANPTAVLSILTMISLVGLAGCAPTPLDGNGNANVNDNADGSGEDLARPVGPDAPPEAPAPQVVVISDDLVPDADGRITLPAAHDAVQPGSVLITGNGTHLFKVETVEAMPDESLRIITSQGSLAQLGIVGAFSFVDPPSEGSAAKAGPREVGADVNLRIINVSMPFSTTMNLTDDGSVSVTAEGIFELDGAFHLAFDIGWRGLNTFSSYMGGDGLFALDASVVANTGANILREQLIPGAAYRTYYHGIVPGPAGIPIPVVVEVTAQLFIGFEGDLVPGSIDTRVEATADVKVGADYDSTRADGGQWTTIAASGFDWGYDAPAVCFDGTGWLRGYLRPHFEVQLYSVVGPTFDVEPYGRVAGSLRGCLADPAVEYDASLSAGAVGYAKIKADVLDRFVVESPRLTVFDVSRELKRWQNSPAQPPEPVPPITFSLPLMADTPGVHWYFDQDIGKNGACKAWNHSLLCDSVEAAYDGHTGTDFAFATARSPVYAAQEGTILRKVDGLPDGCFPCGAPCTISCDDFEKQRGNYIVLDHGDGFRTFYLHMKSGSLTHRLEGETVECGEKLGEVGKSGLATGYHLHFGAHFGAPAGKMLGTPFDPYDGYPYWGTDSPDARAPRSSFWAARDARDRPLKTCVGPPAPDCQTDSDCDDDLFCNGPETCLEGVCASGSDPCPAQACNEAAHSCGPTPECVTDSDCDDRLPGNGVASCVNGACVTIDTMTVGCSASPSSPNTGDPLTWTATAGGGSGPYDFCWGNGSSGECDLGGDVNDYCPNISASNHSLPPITYPAGPLTANVRVTDSGNLTGWASCSITIVDSSNPTSTLTASISGNGKGLVTADHTGADDIPPGWTGTTGTGCAIGSCTAIYDVNDPVLLTAAPGSCVNPADPSQTQDCVFDGWSGDGACSGISPCDFTMTQNKNVTATFSNPFSIDEAVSLSFSPGVLRIDGHPGGSSAQTLLVTITATPNDGGDLSNSKVCLESFLGSRGTGGSIYDEVENLITVGLATSDDYLHCIMNGADGICMDPGQSKQCSSLHPVGDGTYTANFRIVVPTKLPALSPASRLMFGIEGTGFSGEEEINFVYSP